MDKVREFRQRARECRIAAHRTRPDLKVHYENLAAIWDKLAEERLTFFVEDPDPSEFQPGEIPLRIYGSGQFTGK